MSRARNSKAAAAALAPARTRSTRKTLRKTPGPTKASAQAASKEPRTLSELNQLISQSQPLLKGANRAVLGEGPIGAAVAFVGEQPGDQEDLQGRPFVGPAGQLLTRAMAQAGMSAAALI